MNTYEPIFAQNIKEGDTINFSEFQPAFTVTKIKMVLNGVIVTDDKGNTFRKVLPPKMIVKKLVAIAKEPQDSDEEKEIKAESTKQFYKNLKAALAEKRDSDFADTSMKQEPTVQTTVMPVNQNLQTNNLERAETISKINSRDARTRATEMNADANKLNAKRGFSTSITDKASQTAREIASSARIKSGNAFTASESRNENVIPSQNTNNDKKEKSVDLDKPKVSESSKNSLKRLVNFESKAESPNGVDDQYLDSPGILGVIARKLHKGNTILSSDKYKRNIATALKIATI